MKHIGIEIDKIISSNKNFKTKDIADAAGITSVYLSNIKKKDSIDAALLEKIAKALNVSVGYFFDEAPLNGAVNGHKNQVGNGNVMVLNQANEIEHLRKLLEEKDTLIAEKERLIQVLMSREGK
jgi:transcriptional regulator with XRE-family HTH domain